MNTAIVLAAGLGQGAWPYCGLRQKTTLPVAQTPIVRRLALQLRAAGVRDIVVIVGHGEGAVRACTADIAGIRYLRQPAQQGCGDAALVGLAGTDADRVLICYGDIVIANGNLAAIIEADRDRAAEAVVLGAPPQPGLPVWDSIEMDASGQVSGVWCKGSEDHPRFGGVVAGTAALLRSALEQCPGYVDNVGVGAMPPAENRLAAALNRLCIQGHALRCVASPGYVVDVNRPWDLVEANHRANEELFAGRSGVVLGKNAVIDDGAEISGTATVLLGEGAHIGKGVIVEGDIVLGEGARATSGAILGNRVNLGAHSVTREYARVHPNSVVGAHNVIGHCAEFAGVSFEGALLWHYCCVTGVIGAQVDIGAAVCCGTWRFDDGLRKQQVGRHIEQPPYHGAMAFLGDRVRTGVNVLINPGVRIGSHSCIGPGVILYDDVLEDQLVLVKQEHVVKPWGSERYSW